MSGDDITASSSAMEEGKTRFIGHAADMASALESLRYSTDALFGTWQGTGSGNFHEACLAVETAYGIAGKTFLDLGTKIGSSLQSFMEADEISAIGISKLE